MVWKVGQAAPSNPYKMFELFPYPSNLVVSINLLCLIMLYTSPFFYILSSLFNLTFFFPFPSPLPHFFAFYTPSSHDFEPTTFILILSSEILVCIWLFCEILHWLERGNKCQRGRWALKGVDCETPRRFERGMSVSEDASPRRGADCEIPHWLERGTGASKDAKAEGSELWDLTSIGEGNDIDWRGERVLARMLNPKEGWIVRSHIDWRRERHWLERKTSVSEDTRNQKRVDCEMSHPLKSETNHFFYKEVETSP